MSKVAVRPDRLILIAALVLTGCGRSSLPLIAASETPADLHEELAIVDPASYGSSQGRGDVSAQAVVSIGSVYLETQLPAVTVTGTALQATDVATSGTLGFVTYSSVDTGGTVVKKGAVQHVSANNCDNPLTTRTEYCLAPAATLAIPAADIFAGYTDGTNLWVAGSTLDETYAPMYARLFKITLNSNLDPSAIALTQALASYAGTGITKVGANLLVTTGTSATLSQQGGLQLVNATTLVPGALQNYYDARSVAVDPTNAARAFVVRGAISTSNKGAVGEFAADASAAAIREIPTGGNSIAESKSSVVVGQTLILTSLGDQGLRVSCKATGASLATVPAPVVAGIPSTLTVTNSAAALPGYVLAAHGEAGVYIYQFQKSNLLNSNYCQGVTLTLLGRLSLAGSSTYVNGELSANSIKYMPVLNVLNVITSKLVVISSGNKGTSLLNMSGLTLSLGLDVDDF